MNRLLGELLKRNVLGVAAAYLTVGWLIMRFASVMTPARTGGGIAFDCGQVSDQ